MFATAVDDDVIRRNPCRIPGAGTEPSPERPVATLAQFFDLADAVGPRSRALVLLATFTGVRWGEAMALRRRHLNLTNRTVRIEAALSESGGQLVLGPPKSAAGIRTVAIPAAIISDLRHHLVTYAERGPDGRVFTGAKGATVRRSNWHTVWRRACLKAEVEDLHFHDLRHTGNTLAAATGASLRELMNRMGHSSSRAAMIYQHATSDRDRVVADALDAMVKEHRQQADHDEEQGPDDPPRARSGHGG